MIFSNLHVDPYTYNLCFLKKDFLFQCSFSAFNKNFPQFSALIPVKCLLILSRSLFTPIVLRNCFSIFVLSVFYLFVYISSTSVLIWNNFLIYHLGVRTPVPDKWVFLRSSLIRFVSLYTIFIIPLCSCKFLRYYVLNLISWKIFVNDFNPFTKIPLSYTKCHFCQQITFLPTNYIFLAFF